MGLGETTVLVGDGLPSGVEGLSPDAVTTVVEDGTPRRVIVEAECVLDPPMYGDLRQYALRDPALALGLTGKATVTVRIGWLFSRDGMSAAPAVHALMVGDAAVAPTGSERPVWLVDVLSRLGRKIQRGAEDGEERLATRLADALLSPIAEMRQRADRASRAGRDIGIGVLSVVRRDGHLALGCGPDLTPPRRVGADALRAIRIVLDAIIDAPDVLVVDDVPASARRWLGALPETDRAPVEQVWMPATR